jgi:glycosidase
MIDWVAGRTWYHVFALRAASAMSEISAWLDHIEYLGGGGLLLTPLFESSSHGYDTVDPFAVDARLGTEADLVALIDAAHARDIKVVLDGVFNHVGRAFPAFVDVLEHRQSSRFRDWFVIDFDGDGPDGFSYRDFEGHHELVALNHANDEVRAWAVDVATYWLDRGVDGWRLDAAYRVPVDFWRYFTSSVKHEHAQTFLFGEMIHGDYAAFVRASGLDSVTQYELHKAVWSALNDANFFELSWALTRHAGFVATFPPVTFAGNHDVSRIRTQLTTKAHLAHALALLFTVPGVPCIYYGDELAFDGRKEHRAGGDDAIRPRLPRSGVPTSSAAQEALGLHHHLVRLRRARPWLTCAQLELVHVSNTRLAYEVRGEGRVRVELSVGSEPAGVERGGRLIAGSPGPGGWTVSEWS